MSNSTNPLARAITLDQMIALNDEMAALSRAGVPLESGLVQLGEDIPGRLGKIATEIGRRLQSGESLTNIVSNTDSSFPPLYQAVVEAGIRSGRLSAALEGLSTTVRRVAELRRIVGLSLIYPLALIAIAYVCFLLTISNSSPVLVDTYVDMKISAGWWLEWLGRVGQTVHSWWYWPPIVGVVMLVVAWFWSQRFSAGTGRGCFGRLPSLGRLLRAGRMASFAEVLRLLVEQEVPLHEAVVLAADASGDAVLRESSRELARRICAGGGDNQQSSRITGFPPILQWLMTSGSEQQQLVSALRQISQRYRDSATRLSEWMTMYLPILLAVGIGGSATVVLALSTLAPWFRLLHEMAS